MAQDESIVTGVAGRYASAVYGLAADQGVTDAVGADLTRFKSMMDDSPDLMRLVRSPAFSTDEQIKALSAVLARAEIGGLAANFLKLVANKRRLFAVADMIADYRKLDDAAKGVSRATVTVAEPLNDSHMVALKEALAGVSGGKRVDVDVKIDPAIIGGLVVKLGSRMVDTSLRTKLNAIRTRMKEVR